MSPNVHQWRVADATVDLPLGERRVDEMFTMRQVTLTGSATSAQGRSS